MSWDGYLDSLHGYGGITKGCIAGRDGNQWSTSAHQYGAAVKPEEALVLIECVNKQAVSDSIHTNGFYIEGIKYKFLRSEVDSSADIPFIIGKNGATGVVVYFTKSALVIGIHGEEFKSEKCRTSVHTMAAYLVSNGY